MLLFKKNLNIANSLEIDRTIQISKKIVVYLNQIADFDVHIQVMNKLLLDRQLNGADIKRNIIKQKCITWESKYIILSKIEQFNLVKYALNTVLKPINIDNMLDSDIYTLVTKNKVYSHRFNSIIKNILMYNFHKHIYERESQMELTNI